MKWGTKSTPAAGPERAEGEVPGAEPSTPPTSDVPEIPKDQLPPLTRPPPDPQEVQYRSEPVYVSFQEKIWPAEGDAYAPEVRVTEAYVAEYLRRAGHPVVSSASEAHFRLEGDVRVAFAGVLTFNGETIGWKVRAKATLRVLDRAGELLEELVVPEFERANAAGEKSGYLSLRRETAKKLHDLLFVTGKVFTDRDVVRLVELWTTDPLTEDVALSGAEVVERLADIGFRAVPYMLEALADTRTVLADADYPGLVNPDDLKVYHLADKVLEEIFQKVSRLELGSTSRQRFRIIQGWQNEWRRFCPAYREAAAERSRQPSQSEPPPPARPASIK